VEKVLDKTEALAERARLQKLLDTYEASRRSHQGEDERRESTASVTPDRAGNVRARIARLEQIIAEISDV
jgi:hypothetical protein